MTDPSKKELSMKSHNLLLALVIALSFLVLYLLFRLYICHASLSDVMVVLIQQVWSLREFCLLKIHSVQERAIQFSHHALSLPGPRGELLIRRHMLLWDVATCYRGTCDDIQLRLRSRIDELDRKLVAYQLFLPAVTNLTIKMIEDIYRGDRKASLNVTIAVVRKLRTM
jgi:hypothetical protein